MTVRTPCYYRDGDVCRKGVYPPPLMDILCDNCLYWMPARVLRSCNCESDMADASSRRPDELEQLLRE